MPSVTLPPGSGAGVVYTSRKARRSDAPQQPEDEGPRPGGVARLEPVSHGRLEGTNHVLWDTLGDTPVPRVVTVPATGGSSAGRGQQTLELQGSAVSAQSPCLSGSLGGPSPERCPGLGLAQEPVPWLRGAPSIVSWLLRVSSALHTPCWVNTNPHPFTRPRSTSYYNKESTNLWKCVPSCVDRSYSPPKSRPSSPEGRRWSEGSQSAAFEMGR